MGDFGYLDTCWKNNTAAHMLSIKFLEYVEDIFGIQMLDVPIKGEALLDLLLTSQGSLLCKIPTSDSLGCHDHSSGVLLSTLKVSVKTNILDLEEQTSLCSEPIWKGCHGG